MRRHRRNLPVHSEINLTSLLDVAFVLLIAFMIVAPQLNSGVDLKLPGVAQGAGQLAADPAKVQTIKVLPAGADGAAASSVFLNDEPVTIDQLEARLAEKRTGEPGVAVEINADRTVPYEAFVQVVAAVRRAGIEAVGLPVDSAPAPAPAAPTAGPGAAATPGV